MDLYMRLIPAVRFQQRMGENGLTRAELARRLGVSQAWFTKVMGRITFDFATTNATGRILDIAPRQSNIWFGVNLMQDYPRQ